MNHYPEVTADEAVTLPPYSIVIDTYGRAFQLVHNYRLGRDEWRSWVEGPIDNLRGGYTTAEFFHPRETFRLIFTSHRGN